MRALFLLMCVCLLGVQGISAQSESIPTITPTVMPTLTRVGIEPPTPTQTPAESPVPTLAISLTPEPTPLPTNEILGWITDTPTITPTREGEILVYQGVEVMFPQAIRFIIAVSPALFEIESARLTIQFEGREPEVIDVDVEDSAFVGYPYSALNVFWNFTTETVPPLFSTVRYVWDVTATENRNTHVESQHVFQDERLIWTRLGDDRIQLAIGAFTETPPGVLGLVRQAYDALRRVTGDRRTYNWLVYDGIAPGCAVGADGLPIAPNRRGDVSIPCDPAVAVQVYNGQGYDVLRRPPDLALDDALIEYMVRDFFAPDWDVSRPPQWFIDGMAQLFRINQKDDNLFIARTAADANLLFTLDEMRAAPPSDPEQRRLWDAQSYGMVLYLLDRIGIEDLYALALTDKPFDQALESALDEPSDGLVFVWARWLNTSAAENTYGVNPYLPPTLTPSPTPTASFTWTVTPSFTPTITLTPSVTGYLSPTPRPSNTPGDTPDAPTLTPSFTPRPPGSLPTVTPIPPPTVASALAQPEIQSAVLIVLIGVLVILVIAVWRLGKS